MARDIPVDMRVNMLPGRPYPKWVLRSKSESFLLKTTLEVIQA